MADLAGSAIALLKFISSPISKSFKYHRGINEHMKTLKQRLEELNRRKEDVESKLEAELVWGVSMSKEVQYWLEMVGQAKNDVKAIEEKFEKLKYFSRAAFGKNVVQKTQEVEELYRKRDFLNGLVVPLQKTGDLLPTTALEGETTSNQNMERVWSSLMDDDRDRKIGVYGMGGIGKTTLIKHVNNMLLEKKDKFDSVFWVTVSKASSVVKIQEAIASKLDIHISQYADEMTRAARLYVELSQRKRYVLILDDLWECYRLEEVGIPEPSLENGCKFVLTTRTLDVCRGMSCKAIKMECLSKEEALNLFSNIVGGDVASKTSLRSVVSDVAEECACLPLAIVTIAGSLKGVTDPNQWSSALDDLRASRDMDDHIFRKLKFSYDRLKDKSLHACFVYCALFPKDHPIERKMLIEYLIDEGIIKGRNSRRAEFKTGQAMLNKLIDSCLLEVAKDRLGIYSCVKMHDVIRDIAIQITSESPRFLVEAGTGLQFMPDSDIWKNDLEKVSFMFNDMINYDPSSEAQPNCPIMSTLLLRANNRLRRIPNEFFLHMVGLNLLDLSNTGIEALPDHSLTW